MNPARDLSRIDLRAAKLCMELDCNTIFHAAMYGHCPTCGSVESYPLETWLNRERSPRIPAAALDTLVRDTAARFKPRAAALPAKLRTLGQRRRAG